MMKFLLTITILGFLALAAVIAAVPVFTKVVGPDMMADVAPPEGLPLGDRDFPIPERSLFAVKLELPINVLASMANQNAPRELKGSLQKNLHQKISEGVLHWRMWPGPITVNNAGRDLTFHFPVVGDAFSTGRFGKLRVKVKGSAQLEGMLSGRMNPAINSSWEVVPRITPMMRLKQADITLGKLGTFDSRDKVYEALNPIIHKQVAKVGPSLTKALNLKPGIQKVWNQAHIIKTVAQTPNSWVVFDPGFAQLGPIDYSNPESLSITVGMVAQSFITNTEPLHREAEALPDLDLLPSDPVSDIRIPIIANFDALNHTFAERAFPIKNKYGAKIEVSKPQLKLGRPGYLNLRMNINALEGTWGKGLNGIIHVEAKPIINCPNQTMGFTDISLSVESKEQLTRTAGWLMEEYLIKSIEKELRIDLKEHLPELEKEMHKVINSAPVPDHIDLYVEKPHVQLLGAYTIHRPSWNEPESPGIVFVLGAKGSIKVRLKELTL